jgi:hypothetical protein
LDDAGRRCEYLARVSASVWVATWCSASPRRTRRNRSSEARSAARKAPDGCDMQKPKKKKKSLKKNRRRKKKEKKKN